MGTRKYCYRYAPKASRHVAGPFKSDRCQCGAVSLIAIDSAAAHNVPAPETPKVTPREMILDARERTKAAAPVLRTCPVCGEDFVSHGDLYCGDAGTCNDGASIDALAVIDLKLTLAQAMAERFCIREGEQLHDFIQRVCERADEDPPAAAELPHRFSLTR